VENNNIKEVDRAIDNLVKSGKYYPMAPRDATPMVMGGGRRYNEHGRQNDSVQRTHTLTMGRAPNTSW
jgi:hypothetical protein